MVPMQPVVKKVFTALVLSACVCPPAFSQQAPPAQATTQLEQRALHRRAVEAAIWGLPAVNYDLMLQEMLTKTPGKVGQVIYWGRPLDSKNQTLTPNPDALYFMVFFNTKDGPVVLDLPPADEGGSFNANIVTVWQMPLEDAGKLGVGKGKGGKGLILPPGYKGKVPAGYIPLQSDTFGGYMLLRANMKNRADAEVQRSIAYGKRMKIYPLAQAANPPTTVFSDVKDVDFDSTIRYDASFFESLNRIVQAEPWIPRDRAMIDTLRSIGIEKGKPFRPSAETNKVLAAAVREAGEELEARYDAGLPGFFTENSRWTYAVPLEYVKAMSSGFSEPDDYPIHARGLLYSYAYVGIKHLGSGQFYLISLRDKAGRTFDGGKTYRLTVPPNVPVQQYWSATAYDRKTHALIKGMPRASCSSNDAKVQKNADGSVDVYFGPTLPAGKESNWVPTDPRREFELMARFYAPTKAFFDKVWKLPDVEEVK